MEFKKFLFSVILYFALIIAETSFLLPFWEKSKYFNLILISVAIWNIIEKRENLFGLTNAIIGGFFLDIFSSHFFGFYTIISVSIAIFIKFFIKKYVKIPWF